MLLIGSRALQHLFPDINMRKPRDWDFICTEDEYDDFKSVLKDSVDINRFKEINLKSDKWNKKAFKVEINKGEWEYFEFEIVNVPEFSWWKLNEQSSGTKIYDHAPCGQLVDIYDYPNPIHLPSLNWLYLLKMSHRYLRNSPAFRKTMQDIHLMRALGAFIPHEEVYKQRMKETYNYSHPNLNVSKSAFFTNDNIDYIYDHDTIHLAMMHLDEPAYNKYKPNNNEVYCSKEMFFALPEQIRLYGVLEEAQVLALERSQIPNTHEVMENTTLKQSITEGGVRFCDVNPYKSFVIALEKVCTSITSGWFREYAWENYYHVLGMYEPNYVKRFWEAVDNGVVKKK